MASSSSITQQHSPVEIRSSTQFKQIEKKQFNPRVASMELSKKILMQTGPEKEAEFDKTLNSESLSEIIRSSYRIFSKVFGNPNNLERKDFSYTLVLGNTGSGKSTAIGYLLGAELRSEDDQLDYQKPDPSLPKIGHLSTETKGYSVHQNYIDTGGLHDTAGRYDELCHAIGASIATKIFSPSRVIFVIEGLCERNRTWLLDFVHLLQRILPNFMDPKVLSSILILITKSKGKDDTYEATMKIIQSTIACCIEEKDQLLTLYGDTLDENAIDRIQAWQNYINILETLKKATFIFADFLNDDTREKIQNWEKNNGSLTADLLRMEEYVIGAKQTIKVINHAAEYFKQLSLQRERLRKEIATLNDMLEKTESDIETYSAFGEVLKNMNEFI